MHSPARSTCLLAMPSLPSDGELTASLLILLDSLSTSHTEEPPVRLVSSSSSHSLFSPSSVSTSPLFLPLVQH